MNAALDTEIPDLPAGIVKKPVIAVSGVNLVEAGPLAVFQDALRVLKNEFGDRYEIVALVHTAAIVNVPGIRYLEFPEIKASWFRRIRFEYRDLLKLSKTLDAFLWLSMHDMSPRVHAAVRAVYCHNPSPFYRLRRSEVRLEPRFTAFALLYRFLYAINLRHNEYVVVQQDWLRSAFRRMYPKARTIVVAHPSVVNEPPAAESLRNTQGTIGDRLTDSPACFVFFYPAYPRPFKNVELLLQSVELLQGRDLPPFELRLTISGTENEYASRLFARYGSLARVQWLGALPRDEVFRQYAEASCLVFPSRLESWGMPLTEFKLTGKLVLAADLPYAHETLGDYAPAEFFAPAAGSAAELSVDAHALAATMEKAVRGTLQPQGSRHAGIAAPFARDWRELFQILLGESAQVSSPVAARCR